MKIIHQTENELIIKDGNTFSVIFGFILAVIGLGVGYNSFISNSKIVWIGLIFLVFGLLMALLTSTITTEINKVNKQLIYKKKSLVRGKTNSYNTDNILRIETRKEWKMQNINSKNGPARSRPVLYSQSIIVFKDGVELPLNHQKKNSSNPVSILNSSSVLMGGQGKEISLANKIATFLGVPFQEVSPTSTGSGINIGVGGAQL